MRDPEPDATSVVHGHGRREVVRIGAFAAIPAWLAVPAKVNSQLHDEGQYSCNVSLPMPCSYVVRRGLLHYMLRRLLMVQSGASVLPPSVDRAWEAIGGGPADLTFPEAFMGRWIVNSKLVRVDLPMGMETLPAALVGPSNVWPLPTVVSF